MTKVEVDVNEWLFIMGAFMGIPMGIFITLVNLYIIGVFP